jgi:hypothetical protein
MCDSVGRTRSRRRTRPVAVGPTPGETGTSPRSSSSDIDRRAGWKVGAGGWPRRSWWKGGTRVFQGRGAQSGGRGTAAPGGGEPEQRAPSSPPPCWAGSRRAEPRCRADAARSSVARPLGAVVSLFPHRSQRLQQPPMGGRFDPGFPVRVPGSSQGSTSPRTAPEARAPLSCSSAFGQGKPRDIRLPERGHGPLRRAARGIRCGCRCRTRRDGRRWAACLIPRTPAARHTQPVQACSLRTFPSKPTGPNRADGDPNPPATRARITVTLRPRSGDIAAQVQELGGERNRPRLSCAPSRWIDPSRPPPHRTGGTTPAIITSISRGLRPLREPRAGRGSQGHAGPGAGGGGGEGPQRSAAC